MASTLIDHYKRLTHFLGHALGANYEVVLYDLTDQTHKIVAIENSSISGRDMNSGLSEIALRLLMENRSGEQETCVKCRMILENGKVVRTSAFFIKHNGQLVGMLCINFDNSQYYAVSRAVLALCDAGCSEAENGEQNAWNDRFVSGRREDEKLTSLSVSPAAAVQALLKEKGIDAKHLTAEERNQIVRDLACEGIFQLKSGVKTVAEALGCSPVSVYRCLSKIRKESIAG